MIEKMKFLSITGPKADIDRVVNQYLAKYEIHLENAMAQLNQVQNLSPFIQINPYKEVLAKAEEFTGLLGEEKQLKQYCLDLELPDKLLLLQCAHECNPMVEDDLFYSISKGVAFQVLARKGIDQNYKCHADVYGYKRKTLALFRSALQACGRYPF